jgi:hypothetical protein
LITRQVNLIEQQVATPEYSRIISEKQIESLSAVLKSRANNDLAEIINDAKIGNQQFGKIDDYISFLREDAVQKGVNSEDVDKLALKVAVMDNILTQAAVNYLAKHTDGDLNKILTDLNIYSENLKTWSNLQEYVAAKTGGKIKPEDLNNIAAAVLSESNPAISSKDIPDVGLKSKITAGGRNYMWIVWVLMGAGLLGLLLLLLKKGKNTNK